MTLLYIVRRHSVIGCVLWDFLFLPSTHFLQAFINTAKEIYQKIQDGIFDVTNEVNFTWKYMCMRIWHTICER